MQRLCSSTAPVRGHHVARAHPQRSRGSMHMEDSPGVLELAGFPGQVEVLLNLDVHSAAVERVSELCDAAHDRQGV